MEQTLHTTDLRVTDITAAELMALRQHMTHRLLTQAMQWTRALEDLAAPTTPQQIAQHCRAASALMALLNRLIPQRKTTKAEDPAEVALEGLLAELDGGATDAETPNPPPLNRQQRRHAEAMARKQGRSATG